MTDTMPPRHPAALAGFSTAEETAAAISDLRYDALAALLVALQAKLLKDADADDGRKRPALARELRQSALAVGDAARAAERAWTICSPHMPG